MPKFSYRCVTFSNLWRKWYQLHVLDLSSNVIQICWIFIYFIYIDLSYESTVLLYVSFYHPVFCWFEIVLLCNTHQIVYLKKYRVSRLKHSTFYLKLYSTTWRGAGGFARKVQISVCGTFNKTTKERKEYRKKGKEKGICFAWFSLILWWSSQH